MKILLIGGTGTISSYVTRLLMQNGHSVTLLNRGTHPLPGGAGGITADINTEEAEGALAGQSFDVVADFIAYKPQQVQRDIRLFAGRCGQFVFISSASAYQTPPSCLPITESTPLCNPHWQYSRDKIACEELLTAAWRDTGFPATIVRPSHTYSEASIPLGVHGAKGGWPVLRRMQQGKPVLIHGDGTSLWTFTHSRDFARAFVGLLGNPHAIGQAVHITGDEAITWQAAYQCWANALGVQLNAVYVPSTLLAAAGRAHGYDFEGGLLGDKAHSMVFDNRKIKRLVPGFVATTRFDEGARECVAHHLAHPQLQPEDAEFDTFCDRVAAALQTAQASLG